MRLISTDVVKRKVAPVSASKTWNSSFPARSSWLGVGEGRGRGGKGQAGHNPFFFFFFPYCLAGVEHSCTNLFYLVILDPYIDADFFFLFQLGFIAAAAVVVTVVLSTFRHFSQ